MPRRTNSFFLPSVQKNIPSRYTRGIKGLGMGSVLLTGGNGGAGGASSYSSIDDYVNTTKVNPYTNQMVGGRGLARMNNKLKDLNIKTTKKAKNISFTL